MNANLPVPTEFSAIATICVATEGTIGGHKCLTVDGRALHAGLKVGRTFGAWLPARIESYGFQEDSDYEILLSRIGKQNGSGGHNLKDYRLTTDMAKELAMIENNEMGRLARRYFLWVENQAQLAIQPNVSVADIERRIMTALGGMMKGILIKQVGSKIDAIEHKLEAIITPDPSAEPNIGFQPMLFFVENAGVTPKGRRNLVSHMSRKCISWMDRNGLSNKHKVAEFTRVKHFHVDAIPRWMQIEGAAMIRAHMDKMTGQGTLAPKGKKGRTELSPRPFSRPKEAAS